MSKASALQDLSLYELIGSTDRSRSVSRVTYAKGKIIYQPGDTAKFLYLIHSGYVRVYRLSAEGREVTLALLGAGDLLGELALISDSPQTTFAEVMAEAELSLMPQALFQEMLGREPEVAYRLMLRISRRLQLAEDLIEDLVNRDVTSRVARTLLSLADQFGRWSPLGTVIDLRIPYQEIANMVGSTRETVTRSISQMQQNEWVRLEGGRLHLLDNDALAQLSQ